jgi:hypothetical protein
VGIPEMQRFTFRLQAISASEFERSPNRVEGYGATPSVIKKPPRPRCAGEEEILCTGRSSQCKNSLEILALDVHGCKGKTPGGQRGWRPTPDLAARGCDGRDGRDRRPYPRRNLGDY